MFTIVALAVAAAVAILFVGFNFGLAAGVLAWMGFTLMLLAIVFLRRR